MNTEVKAQHTPEPWSFKEDELCGDPFFEIESEKPKWAQNHLIAQTIIGTKGHWSTDVERANMRRIVAAINACKVIPTEALEGGQFRAIFDAAVDWVNSHPGREGYTDEHNTNLRSGYLYDRVRRYEQKLANLEGRAS